jgi:hypothetical protein
VKQEGKILLEFILTVDSGFELMRKKELALSCETCDEHSVEPGREA